MKLVKGKRILKMWVTKKEKDNKGTIWGATKKNRSWNKKM